MVGKPLNLPGGEVGHTPIADGSGVEGGFDGKAGIADIHERICAVQEHDLRRAAKLVSAFLNGLADIIAGGVVAGVRVLLVGKQDGALGLHLEVLRQVLIARKDLTDHGLGGPSPIDIGGIDEVYP